jgi:hypothetical protein
MLFGQSVFQSVLNRLKEEDEDASEDAAPRRIASPASPPASPSMSWRVFRRRRHSRARPISTIWKSRPRRHRLSTPLSTRNRSPNRNRSCPRISRAPHRRRHRRRTRHFSQRYGSKPRRQAPQLRQGESPRRRPSAVSRQRHQAHDDRQPFDRRSDQAQAVAAAAADYSASLDVLRLGRASTVFSAGRLRRLVAPQQHIGGIGAGTGRQHRPEGIAGGDLDNAQPKQTATIRIRTHNAR